MGAQWLRPVLLLIALLAFIALLWMGWWIWGVKAIAASLDHNSIGKYGQVGDIFGGINALFAALAFAGVAVAAYYQRLAFRQLAKDSARQTQETQDALTISRDMYRAEHRPWVTVQVSLRSDLSWTKTDGWQFEVEYELQNRGGSPAMNIDVQLQAHPQMASARPSEVEAKRLSELGLEEVVEADWYVVNQLGKLQGSTETSYRRGWAWGTVLFPGEKSSWTKKFALKGGKFETARHFSSCRGLFVLACIAYGYSFDSERYGITGRTYLLRRPPDPATGHYDPLEISDAEGPVAVTFREFGMHGTSIAS